MIAFGKSMLFPSISPRRKFPSFVLLISMATRSSMPDPIVSRYSRVAAAVHRNPAYFVEYRQLLVMEALDQLFTRQPNMATHLYRKFVAAHPEVR